MFKGFKLNDSLTTNIPAYTIQTPTVASTISFSESSSGELLNYLKSHQRTEQALERQYRHDLMITTSGVVSWTQFEGDAATLPTNTRKGWNDYELEGKGIASETGSDQFVSRERFVDILAKLAYAEEDVCEEDAITGATEPSHGEIDYIHGVLAEMRNAMSALQEQVRTLQSQQTETRQQLDQTRREKDNLVYQVWNLENKLKQQETTNVCQDAETKMIYHRLLTLENDRNAAWTPPVFNCSEPKVTYSGGSGQPTIRTAINSEGQTICTSIGLNYFNEQYLQDPSK